MVTVRAGSILFIPPRGISTHKGEVLRAMMLLWWVDGLVGHYGVEEGSCTSMKSVSTRQEILLTY